MCLSSEMETVAAFLVTSNILALFWRWNFRQRRVAIYGRKNKNYVVFKQNIYEGWNFNSGNYLFTTDT